MIALKILRYPYFWNKQDVIMSDWAILKNKLCVLIMCFFFAGSFSLSAQEGEYKSVGSDNIYQTDVSEKQEKEKAKEDKPDKKWDWRNFRVGGNLGLNFGRYTYVEISPAFGYWVKPGKLQLGVSTKFIYQSIENSYWNSGASGRWKSFLYGGGLFLDYVAWRGLFLRGEFEQINKESYYSTDRVNVPHLLLGAGYIQPMGNFGNFYIAALYNVLDRDESIYAGTFRNDFPLILRMGFGVGFGGTRR